METKDLVDKLNSIIKLDNDALQSYNKAIDIIDIPDLRDRIMMFRDDHERHVMELSDLVSSLGATPTSNETDIRGLFLGGATALRSMMGTEGVLKALHTGEKLTNREYSDATEWDVSGQVHAVLMRNYQDELRHISFIEIAINKKIWENR